MPGLLDFFGSADPQQQGLLAAAAQMLQASGPSLMPHSFGQVLGAGLGGYQQGQQQAIAQQQALQLAKLNDLKFKDAESDLKNQEMIRERQRRIVSRLAGLDSGTPGATAPGVGATPATMASAMPGPAGSPKIGGPDWMQAFQQQNGLRLPAPAMAASQPQSNQTDAYVARLLSAAQAYAAEGDMEGANKLYEQAAKLRPKYSTDFRVAQDAQGKMRNYVLADDGSFKDTGLGVAPSLTEVDLGGTKQFVDKNGIAPGTVYTKTRTPDAIAADQRAAADRAAAGEDAVMDPLAVRLTAQQYLAGDTGALQNFGRGAQGAKNLNAVRLEITKQANAAGLTGADIAAKVAEFGGIKAGQRTAGTRSANIEIAANEAAQLAPLALDASSKVARSGFLPFGKAQLMFDANANDPNMRQFVMANTALVNAYGQAMARGGSASVSDKEHAREMLSTAMDQPSYAAAVSQMMREIKAAQAAPKTVRRELSNGVTGRDGEGATAPGGHQPPGASPYSVTAPNGKTYSFDNAKDLANFKLSAGLS